MNIEDYYQIAVDNDKTASKLDALHGIPNKIRITASQGSRFAKEIAQDFNPLHNPDSKRFCVPGDLLFSLVLMRFGISQKMEFDYQGMVSGDAVLEFNEKQNQFSVEDLQGKAYLSGQKQGDLIQDEQFIAGFCEAYVAFSGMSFPHILVPLMRDHNVMINPSRPMVIYEKMAFEFDRAIGNLTEVPQLVLQDAKLEVDGKRGTATIPFGIELHGRQIGKGYKTMRLSGLRPFDSEVMDDLVKAYEDSKIAYYA